MKVRGRITGAVRHRRSLFGKMILQVEYRWTGMAAYQRNVGEHTDWRDADWQDVKDLGELTPQKNPALRKRPPGAKP